VDLFHPKVVRGTAGATGVIPHVNGDLSQLLPELEAAGRTVFALDVGDDTVPLEDISSAENGVLLVGNEAHGVNAKHLTKGCKKVRISSTASQTGVESLNAAVATSIALYDLSAKLIPRH
jgi:TrmH family RNA methyltransferase